MEINEIQSIDDLQSLGTLTDLVTAIASQVSPLVVEANTYEDLFKIVCCLQQNWLPFAKGPFVSKQAEFVFYLTKLEGKQRNKAIGLTDELYEDTGAAKRWFKKLSQVVHPDKGGDADAFNVLKKLYDVIVDAQEDKDV